MNRREFLYNGAATTAAMAGARSYAQILGANERVSLGIIGLGRRGIVVSTALLQDSRARIAALCDVYGLQTRQFQARFATQLHNPSVDVDYHGLLARKDLDAVVIATPDHLHVQMACDSLGAGKHVYLEKPTVHEWKDRTRLQQAAGSTDKILQCGMQQRSGTHYARAKQQFFDSGELGDVVLVRAVWSNFPWQRRDIGPAARPADLDWSLFLGPAPKAPYEYVRYTSWRSFPEYGKGVLADILTHWADVAQWMLNDSNPQRAASLGGIYNLHDERENPDTVSAIVQYRKWNLNFESSVLSIRDDNPSVYFEGTKGLLNLAREGWIFTPNQGEPRTYKSPEDLVLAHTKNFLDAVITSTPVSAPLSAGLAATLPVELALHSYWSQKFATPADLA